MVTNMIQYGWNHSFSSLKPILNGAHPDDAFSTIPYEKGYQFLYYLETLVGKEKFQAFYRHYINTFSEKSIGVKDMRALFEKFVEDNFTGLQSKDILGQI